MSMLSVPLTPELENMITHMVEMGVASNKAEVARKAIKLLAEEEAVNAVLKAEKEMKEGKGLSGDLDELAAKII